MAKKQWIVKKGDQNKAQEIADTFQLSHIVSNLLVNRGICTDEQIEEFLYGDFYDIPDPFLLNDMDKACDRIAKAISRKEKMTVFGDYDVDGVTSTAVLVSFLKEKGANVDYYIPSRVEEGYGMNLSALYSIKAENTSLIITVDSGVTAFGEVDWCNDNGIDVIITDHHECKDKLPSAVAVINPKRVDSHYPFCDFAGVGVVFKLICALSGSIIETEKYCDLVAIGTIADVMPVIGENRSIVKKGLSIINSSKRPGVKAIFDSSGIDTQKKVTTTTIGFSIAPRINAAGRIGCAKRAVELFLTGDMQTAQKIAVQLCEENRKRRDTECEIMTQALQKLDENGFYENDDKVIVLWEKGWHSGVIGIVASRLCERFGRPAILFSLEGETGKGSARSIKTFNIYAAIEKNAGFLEQFGGHEMAAGLCIKKENIENFKREINTYADTMLTDNNLCPILEIDMELSEEDLTMQTVRDIEKLGPFGTKNPVPLFVIRDVHIQRITPIGNDKHIKMVIAKGSKTVSSIAFSTSCCEFAYTEGDRVDIAGTFDINEYNGLKCLQLTVADIQLSQEQFALKKRYEELGKVYHGDGELSAQQCRQITPKREHFVAVYQYIKNVSEKNIYKGRYSCLNRKIERHCKIDLNPVMLNVCLDVFQELSILDYHVDRKMITIQISDMKGKIDLGTSRIWSVLKERDKEYSYGN